MSEEALKECWSRFVHALRPLHDAGRLGVVILQYPRWFTPKAETRAVLAVARDRLAGYQVAVEFRSPKWLADEACEDTLEWLEGNDLGFVCSDGPEDGPRAMPLVVAATAEVSVVRFHGRRQEPEDPWPWPYRYPEHELAEWVPRIRELATCSREVHALMDNTWRDDAVHNARTLARLLAD